MFIRRLTLAILVMFLLLAVFIPSTSAGLNDGLAFSLGCSGFTSEGGSFVLDRNNTNTGRETFVMSATDGDGTVIFDPASNTFLMGARITFDAGDFFAWTTAPKHNPLTLSVISSAGNNLPEQEIYKTTGTCSSLGDIQNTGPAAPANGVASPSVPINGTPPKPVNVPGVASSQVGYAIVNTTHLTIRSGDGIEFTPVAVVNGGTELIVLGRNANSSWWYVQVGDVRGWVNATLIVLRGDLTTVPVFNPEGEIIPATLVVFYDLPIFAAPGQTTGAICVIPGSSHGIEYVVVAQTPKGSFYQIEANCNNADVTGWIDATKGVFRNPSGIPVPVKSQ